MFGNSRVGELLAHFSTIGRTSCGGVTRLGYSREERRAHRELETLTDSIDVIVETDFAGNTFVFNRTACEERPTILIGSHLDSVPNGGNFDGVTGVVCGLEVLHRLSEAGLLDSTPVKLVAFACEESAPFGMSSLGAKLALGMISLEQLARTRDVNGMNALEAMEHLGLSPARALKAPSLTKENTRAMLEAHVEQGPILHAGSIPLAIVSDISAPVRLCVTVTGSAQHSGATPMGKRKDALVAASRLIGFVEREATVRSAETCVATVGRMEVSPNAANVIPDLVRLWVDVRDVHQARRNEVVQAIEKYVLEQNSTCVCGWAIEKIQEDVPQTLSGVAYDSLHRAASTVTPSPRLIVSGAGHDSLYTARAGIPTGMLFLPSVDGVSHNPKELTDVSDIEQGVDVLYRAVLDLASS